MLAKLFSEMMTMQNWLTVSDPTVQAEGVDVEGIVHHIWNGSGNIVC